MTDLGTKTRSHIPYIRRMAFGGMAGLMVLGSGAAAGGLAWDRFEAACLGPMLEFREMDTAGMAPSDVPAWLAEAGGQRAYAGGRRHLLVEGETLSGGPVCGVAAAPGAGSDLAPRFDSWISQALAEERFEQVAADTFESLIHEPRISLALLPATETRGPMIWVTQTDKES